MTEHSPKYYLKFLDHDRMPAHGGKGQWPAPGIWTEEVKPIPCQQGWHLCRKQDLFHWLHETLWVVEAEGNVVSCDDKVVTRRARLVRQVEEWCPRNQRLWAADCAEHVLHHWEDEYPDDDRPRKAIETARRYARGEATEQERNAAWVAAVHASRTVTRPAWSAAGFAAGAAAEAALTYERDAAQFATESARSASRRAAGYAAWSTAWTTEWSTECAWQIEHLFKEYLKLDPNDFH